MKRGILSLTKRGQLTMFIIFGIMVSMGVLFFMFMQGGEQEIQAKEVQQETSLTQAERLSITNYVQNCLERVTEDGLALVGTQGGKIYGSQGGIDPDYTLSLNGRTFHDIDGLHIPILLKRSPLARTGAYPWAKFPYIEHEVTGEVIQNFSSRKFGLVEMPPLYATDGPLSIEAKLSTYIENNVNTCIDGFADFEERYDFEYYGNKTDQLVEEGIARVTMVIAFEDFVVNMQYPFAMVKEGKRVRFRDFTFNPQIRLRRVYNATLALIREDGFNSTFHMQNDAENILEEPKHISESIGPGEYASTGEVLVDRSLTDNGDDLIQVIDRESTFRRDQDFHSEGKYFTFTFFRQNRPPVLYYVTDDVSLNEVSGEDLIHVHDYKEALNVIDGDYLSDSDVEQIYLETPTDPVQGDLTGSGTAGVFSRGLRYAFGNELTGNVLDHNFDLDVTYVPTLRSVGYSFEITQFDEPIPCNPPPGMACMLCASLDPDNPCPPVPTMTVLYAELIHEQSRSDYASMLESGDYSQMLFMNQLRAIDPDEDDYEFDVRRARDTTGVNFADRPKDIRQNECCNGLFLEYVVTDEHGSEDSQEVQFLVDQQLDPDGKKCHMDGITSASCI